MTLTFLIRRRAALKALGSVLDAACRRVERVCICAITEAKDPLRPGDFTRWPRLVPVGLRQLEGTVIGVATEPRAHVGVPQWFDNILAPYATGAQTQCYLSAWHQQLHCHTVPSDRQRILDSPMVGWTQADQRPLLGKAPRAGHVFFTMKRRVPEPWRRSWAGRRWYAQKIRHAVRLAQEEGWPLVFKTRAKHGDPWWLPYYGRVVYDDSMYPATSLQLLSGARLATTFMSAAFAEARWLDVPVVDYPVPHGHLDLPGQRELYAGLLDNDAARDEYLARFMATDDGKAGERVVDVAEAWRP